ncbi:MAG TPA: UDP-3-O-acyl-N-acetylglucosamine deacetylase [Nitrospirales bacterium]|nr:UDP-3-O-acyl-N-acetylglucosamine deacetylase [Nitrospirales bacterium]
MRQQQTIARSMTCSGVGLHTGQPVTLTLRPAAPGTGIVFIQHANGGPVAVSASARNLTSTELCTGISADGFSVKTVEHLLAALTGLGIDNVYAELTGGEVPAMDGSAGPFVRLLQAAGVVPQDRRQPYLKITQPIEVSAGDRSIAIVPATTPRITYTIQYDHALIGRQTYDFQWTPYSFEREIADARTFGFLDEVEQLWSRGLGKGGSLDNTIVIGDRDVVNDTGLRYRDEFVRHKVLDLIGDLSLLGRPLIGHLVADRAGHALHAKLVEQILEQRDKWVLVSADDKSVVMPGAIGTYASVTLQASQIL